MNQTEQFKKPTIEIVETLTDIICISVKLDDGIDTPLDEWD